MEVQLKPGLEAKIKELTSRNVGSLMALVFNNIVYLAPSVSEPIATKRIELGFGDKALAENLIEIIKGEKIPQIPDMNPDPDAVKSLLKEEKE